MLQDDINFSNICDEDDDWVSKSSIKRYGKHLRDIGAQIIALSQTEFDRIPFDDDDSLKVACIAARKMKPRTEELRRELLHIESLLRNREDYILKYENALKAIASTMVAGNATFHRLEETRNDLIEGGIAAINKLISDHLDLDLDRQKLRTLVSKAKKELQEEKESGKLSDKKAYKELFQYLKQIFI